MKTGRQRRKSIRAMASQGVAMCRDRVARRRRTFLAFERNGVDALTAMAWAQYHDASYALSIAEGFYDPRSEKNKFVLRGLSERGAETTPAEPLAMHRGIVEKMRALAQEHRVPQEFGSLVRFATMMRMVERARN